MAVACLIGTLNAVGCRRAEDLQYRERSPCSRAFQTPGRRGAPKVSDLASEGYRARADGIAQQVVVTVAVFIPEFDWPVLSGRC